MEINKIKVREKAVMRKIIPTVFARNKREFNERFERLYKVSHSLQIDFMDNRFVRGKSVNLKDIPNLRGKRIFEAHLMVNYPSKYLFGLKKKGFSKVIFHIECKEDAEKIIKKINKLKMTAFIAVNPSTNIKDFEGILDKIKGVLFMGVYPGREGQKFVGKVYGKIKRFKLEHQNVRIQVDGGVNLNNISKLKEVGVSIVNTGSFVDEADNPRKALKMLKRKFI